jgi:hypothetical protein
VTALEECVGELEYWLPRAQALTHIPDTTPSPGRARPASKPPWNSSAAMAVLDAAEGARQLEAAWRAGRLRPISATGAVLASLVRLSYAAGTSEEQHAAVLIARWTTAILELPAIDREEPPRRITWPCPYCGFRMVMLYPREGRVTCLRRGACYDADGQHPTGLAGKSRMNGEPQVLWRDGLVT